MGLGHVCVFWLVGWGGGSASGHGFVSGWLGKERGGGAGDGGIWRWWVWGGEVLSVSMLPLHGISERFFEIYCCCCCWDRSLLR